MPTRKSKIQRISHRVPLAWNESGDRLILYADFMGFKERVYSTDHEKLRNTLEQFNQAWHNRLQPLQMSGELKFVQFSDSVLVIVNGINARMFNLLTKAAISLMHEALKIHFGIKGVIAQGVFSFDNENGLYFGRPLVDAYLLHEEIKYYGIVVHHTAENTVKNNVSRSNPYSKEDVYIEKGKVAHYHLCWNMLDENLDTKDISVLCNSWLDSIEETVSGHPRQYIDKTREVLKSDSNYWNNKSEERNTEVGDLNE